ncbi:hypothetical protein [Bacillus sp. FJAT-29937]|nr:hypothetical protein [Bacillus sp. FJAT-29937]
MESTSGVQIASDLVPPFLLSLYQLTVEIKENNRTIDPLFQ